MAQFYDPDFHSGNTKINSEESKHIVRVLRMSEGQNLAVIDGKGNRYSCLIRVANSNGVEVEIEHHECIPKRDIHLHLAFSPTKSRDRTEWLLEKAVELGVEEITPLVGDHSERFKVNVERWNKIMISAMKQSNRAHLPILNDLMKANDIWPKAKEHNKYLAHCADGEKTELTDIDGDNLIIAIGPEGDFSAREIENGLTAGWTPLSLGNMRLRTETAGLITCAAVALKAMKLR